MAIHSKCERTWTKYSKWASDILQNVTTFSNTRQVEVSRIELVSDYIQNSKAFSDIHKILQMTGNVMKGYEMKFCKCFST